MNWRGLLRLGPWWLVAAISAVGFIVVAGGRVRAGGYLFALSLVLAAALRAVLAPARCGGLRVRRRWVDVFCLLGLAVVVFAAFALVRLQV